MNKIITWKLWLHFFGYMLCFVIVGSVVEIININLGYPSELLSLILEVIKITLIISCFIFYTKFFVKQPLINDKTLSYSEFYPLQWGLFGFILPISTIGIFYLSGNLEILKVNNQISQKAMVSNGLYALRTALGGGLIEEILFRGYLVNLLNRKYKLWFSVLLPSLLFSLMHIDANDPFLYEARYFSVLLLGSVMYLLIYKKSGSIWNACLVHFLWNLLFFSEFIAYGKDKDLGNHLLKFDMGSGLFNLGHFNIAASIPVFLVYTLAIIFIWYFFRNQKSCQ